MFDHVSASARVFLHHLIHSMNSEDPYPFSTYRGPVPDWLRSLTAVDAVNIIGENPQTLQNTYTRTIFRIEKETHALKICADLGMMDDVYYGFDDQIGMTPVAWADKTAVGDAQYNMLTDRISSPWTPPSQTEILATLAILGKFPSTVDMIVHELLHKHQMPTDQLRRLAAIISQQPGANINSTAGKELMEVISYRLTTMEPHEVTPLALIDHIQTSKGRDGKQAYKGFDMNKVAYLVVAVDSLLALDINTLDLCRLVFSQGGWDYDKHKFPHIEKKIAELAAQRHIPVQDLPRQKVLYVSRRVQDTQLTRAIATEELISALVTRG